MRILLVDDNEVNRDMLSRRLCRRGFNVVTAANGAIAIEVATRELPDIILMDMNMPVLNGWDATRALKAAESTQGIPVVALTADDMIEDHEKALSAGCDYFETKPIDFERLLRTVARATDRVA